MLKFKTIKRKISKSYRGKLPRDFDANAYLSFHEDVASSGMTPEQHYLLHGRHEKRLYSLDSIKAALIPADFDEKDYLDLNPDVAQSGESAITHYARFGHREGRIYKKTGISKDDYRVPVDFDDIEYLTLNVDIATFKGSPREHYAKFGIKEGRKYKADNRQKSTNKLNFPPYEPMKSKNRRGSDPVNPKIVAFYLPQYHRIKENDSWWGEGFTEWTNVRKAVPNFVGHSQPHVPLNKNYYDLSDRSVQENQSILAKQFGVHAFCYYMYWFNGRRVLEKPLDQMLSNKNIDTEFCICWANENWTRTWDGNEKDVLLAQVHSPESDRAFILDAMKYLSDPRYMRVNGKLMLLVYRVDLIENCAGTASIWREEVRRAGLGELYLCAVQFYGITDPTPWGFDAAIEFPPHGWLEQSNLPDEPYQQLNKNFSGHIFDYKKSIDHALRKTIPDYNWHRSAFPGWDNTARRQNTPHIFAGNNPTLFESWLTQILRQQIIMSEPSHQVVFINAWNEWGEGAHLEPDEHFGYGNLEAVSSSLRTVRDEGEVINILRRLRRSDNYSERESDELTLLNILRGHEQSIRYLSQQLAKSTNREGDRQ